MKFSHIADCHIGSYRDERMRDLTIEAFRSAVNISIDENVDFVLISGDLFNTSIPSIDSLKATTSELKRLLDRNIPVYVIAGSHDFSPSGKTMLDVLDNAGLCKNVVKGSVNEEGLLSLNVTTDLKTNIKITGMIGKRGTLEKSYYKSLDTSSLEKLEGFKIFMFHSAITELKPKGLDNMESAPMSFLPKGFNYYAGGHVHSVMKVSSKELGGVIAYPGPLFPNSFSELEALNHGGFYIFDSSIPELLKFVPVEIKKVFPIKLDATNLSPDIVTNKILELAKDEVRDKIVLLRIKGKLVSGRPSDIDMKSIFEAFYDSGAYFVMKNTSSLVSDEFEEISVDSSSIHDIEEKVVKENVGQFKFSKLDFDSDMEHKKSLEMLEILDVEKQDGENQKEFEERIIDNLGLFKEDS